VKSYVIRLAALAAFVAVGCTKTPTPEVADPDTPDKKAPDVEKKQPDTDVGQKVEKPADKRPKILARAPWQSNQLAPRTGDARNAMGAAIMLGAPFGKWNDKATQDEARAKFAKLFKKDKIDWNKEMVLLVEAGYRKAGGHGAEITGLEVKDDTLIVKWKVIEPKEGQPLSPPDSNPGVAVLVDYFKGPITFDPRLN
jgi:hypothetical protein